ncbi:MAG: cupin domain-containing protein [Candidatus Binatus sp.]|jgi:PhnB protein|uniref:cupin domain-containing protein n=2 Tax=Candidatus Binatus sp. TaxID=2811406 RepID=UPI003C7797F3
MAKGKLIEQLDHAVEAIMAKPDASLPTADPRLAGILRIAGELRDLPRADFRDRLKADLAAQSKELEASAPGGKPLITHEDIEERLKELAAQPKFIVHDVRAALSDLPQMSMRFLDSMNNHLLVASRGDKRTNWERHFGSDEMIYVMDGETDVVTLTDGGPVESTIHAGSLFVCPEGLWHRLTPRPFVSAFYLTPGNTAGSAAKDPRPKNERVARRQVRRGTAARLKEHDLRAALREVPHLNITADTTAQEANAAVRNVAKIGNLTLGVMSYTGLTPWERHPDGDELLLALDGELEVTVLTDEGPVTRKLRAGEAFVCPQGLWHRQLAAKSVSMLYGTPTDTTEISMADDPRVEKKEAGAAAPGVAGSIMPFLNIEGVASAVEFYKSVFGASVLMRDEEPSGIVSHAMLKLGDTTVMLSDPTSADVKQNDVHHLSRSPRSYGGSPVQLYIYVADTDDVVRRAVAAGAKIIDPVEDRDWGDRCGGIEDPYGHVWFVGTPLKDVPPKDSN